jgi:hypothetical protein
VRRVGGVLGQWRGRHGQADRVRGSRSRIVAGLARTRALAHTGGLTAAWLAASQRFSFCLAWILQSIV